MCTNSIKTPKVFISYAHGNDDHVNKVSAFVQALRKEGIDADVDQHHRLGGQEIYQFEKTAIKESDYVLVIVDDFSKGKLDKTIGGQGTEKEMLDPNVYNHPQQNKVIQIKDPDSDCELPYESRIYFSISFSSDNPNDYPEQDDWDDLICHLFGLPPKDPTPLGQVPEIIKQRLANRSKNNDNPVSHQPTADRTETTQAKPRLDENVTDEDLILYLKTRLRQKLNNVKTKHPSIQLLKTNQHIVDHALYPKVVGKDVPLPEILQEAHRQTQQTHLIIEGEGGLGKSVALLTIFTEEEALKPATTIYIPLNALDFQQPGDCLELYIRTQTLSKESQLYYKYLNKIAEETWTDAPSLTLLLDGLNEIPNDNYPEAKRYIELWAKKTGVQLIITSRPDPRNYELDIQNIERFKLEAQPKDVIEKYLKTVGLPIPAKDDSVWKIISNPLMLNLYRLGERLKQINDGLTGDSEISHLKEGASEGIVIWNYLQYEKHRITSQKSEEEEFPGPDIGYMVDVATRLVAPYIAYQMLKTHSFTVTSSDFDIWGKLSLVNIKDLDWGTGIRPLLLHNLHLFHKTPNSSYELMHQQFRDALSAIHLINVIDKMHDDTVPDEWKEPIGVIVMTHIADLISEDQANLIWETNRLHPTDEKTTINVLDMQWHRLNGHLSNLNFSGLDLSNTLLLAYCVPESLKLDLPTDAEKMVGVKLSEYSFKAINEDAQGRRNAGSGRVVALAATPDGKYIVSGSWDNVLQVWSTDNGHCQFVLREHGRQVSAVTINEKWCVSGSFDESIIVWDCADWSFKDRQTVPLPIQEEQNRLRKNSNCVNTLCLSKIDKDNDTCLCFSGWSDGYIRIWEINNLGRLTLKKQSIKIANKRVISLAITSNGKYCVARTDTNKIIIWDWANEKTKEITSYGSLACGLAIHNNICVFSDRDRRLNAIDLTNFENGDLQVSPFAVEHDSLIESVAFTHDGEYVVSGSWDLTIRIWSMKTKECLHTLKGHTRRVQAVAVSPDGKFVYSGSRDRTIKVWDFETGKCLRTMLSSSHEWISAINDAGDHRCVIGCEDGSIRVWDTQFGRCLKVFATYDGLATIATTYDEHGKFCISGDNEGNIIRWDLNTETGNPTKIGKTTSSITSISIETPFYAVGKQNGEIEIWRLTDDGKAKLHNTFKHGYDWVNIVRLKNKKCYSGSSDKTIKVWDIERGIPLEEKTIKDNVIRGRIQSLDVTPNENIIVSGEGELETETRFVHKKIQIWTGNQQGTYNNYEGIHGAWKGDNPLAIIDDNNIIIQQSKKILINENNENDDVIMQFIPVLRQYGITSHKQALHTKFIILKSWLSTIAFDNKKGCYFGTNKGYVGYWPNPKKIDFSEWPVLMDIDVRDINFSKSDMDEELKNLLKCNGAIVDPMPEQAPKT